MAHMKTNIALIGFMGTGKTSVAATLATRLGKSLVTLDSLIAHQAGKPIAQIFAEEGELRFRELEIATIKEIACRQNLVIDCGGGVVLNQINMLRLRQTSLIVWLTASPAAIYQRLSQTDEIRPLLQGGDALAKIQTLLKFRKPLYQAAADWSLATARLSVSQVSDRIIERITTDGTVNLA